MIYVSMVEIYFKARKLLRRPGREIGLLDDRDRVFRGNVRCHAYRQILSLHENPHEMHRVEEMRGTGRAERAGAFPMRMGVLTAIAIAIHNFPKELPRSWRP